MDTLFRRFDGRDGLRDYVAGSFAEEVAPAVLRFDGCGLVTEARDYSHLRPGPALPPVTVFTEPDAAP
jgi:hypothetical protein